MGAVMIVGNDSPDLTDDETEAVDRKVREMVEGHDDERVTVPVPPDLAAMAAGVDGDGGVPAVGGGAHGGGLAGEIEGLGGLLVLVLSKRWTWVPDVWTSADVSQIAAAAAAVCDKHGWLKDGIQGGPEVMLALALAGPVIATVERARDGDGAA